MTRLTRAERRASLDIAKAKSTITLRINGTVDPTPKQIGTQAAMHNTCPCWACTMKEPPKTKRFLSDLVKLHAY